MGEVILLGAIASLHPAKAGSPEQQLQQQIQAWQVLLEKLGGNEWALTSVHPPSVSASSQLQQQIEVWQALSREVGRE